MYQHIEADLLLPLDRRGGLDAQELLIGEVVDLALDIGGTRLAHLGRLREGADRRGRKARQAEPSLLRRPAIGERRGALRHAGIDRRQPRRDPGIVDQRRGPARCHRRARRCQRFGDRLGTVIQRLGQHGQLADLLHGKGKPLPDLRIERGLDREIDRDVKQRAGWREDQVAFRRDRRDTIDQHIEIGAPDVAAVDHAERQQQVRPGAPPHCVKLLRRTDQVDVQAMHRQVGRQLKIVAERAEIGRQHHLRPIHRQAPVRQLQRRALVGVEIEHQTGLVDLHPVGTRPGELRQHFLVNRQNRVEERQRGDILALGQRQPGHRAEQHRPCVIAERLCLEEFVDRLGRRQGEFLPRGQFWHHVVIVGVEPLGHFLRGAVQPVRAALMALRLLCATSPLRATRHREISVEADLAAFPAIARRHRAEHRRGVEHMIVEREVAAWDDVSAKRLLPRPGSGAQPLRGERQRVGVRLAGPEAF
ncbi:hypothetical protein MGWOODY_Smn2480 [hydrothermal vent metagenome]|uniref:Uncharacterized protein n=1 Tax=hydrothermal vent metagenome TaxID=652676 RepID=A0A161K5J9_9ZZZZ